MTQSIKYKCKNLNCKNFIECKPSQIGHKRYCNIQCRKEYKQILIENKREEFIISNCKECKVIIKSYRQRCGKLIPKKLCANCNKQLRNKLAHKMTERFIELYNNNQNFRNNIHESHKGQIPWNKGKTKCIHNISDDIRKKLRMLAIKRISDKRGFAMIPNFNPRACNIIDEYGKQRGYNFQHAMNGGEICIDGYFPDGIDKEKKIIIEIDEKHHFNSDGTYRKKDIRRQLYLENLGYKIIRLSI